MAGMDMKTTISSLLLKTPVLAAAGTFGYGVEVTDLTAGAELGALITPTLTLQPREGNPMPRTVEAHCGLVHALGLPNPGLEGFVREIAPGLAERHYPVIVSIWGESGEEWRRIAERLDAVEGVGGVELNLTPAHLLFAERSREVPAEEARLLEWIEETIAVVRRATGAPLIAKLPSVGVEIGIAARYAEAAGADAIAVSQAFPGVAVRLSAEAFRLPGVVGGLSGPAIKPLALYQVWRAAQSVQIPIIGSGGVMTADDALEFLMAGASAVAVGTAGMIHPASAERIVEGIRQYLAHQGILSLDAVVGRALR